MASGTARGAKLRSTIMSTIGPKLWTDPPMLEVPSIRINLIDDVKGTNAQDLMYVELKRKGL